MIIARKPIDLKHHVEAHVDVDHGTGETKVQLFIVKSTNEQSVPDEEPLILFRGRDHLAIPLLAYYAQLCKIDGCNDFQMDSINRVALRFREFAEQYPERMKQPGVTRGL